jgi:PKD repeat protein
MQINCIFVNGKKYLFMKQIYLLILGLITSINLLSQTTVVSAPASNGSLGGGGGHGIQFWVKNNNTYPIRLFRINASNSISANPVSHTYSVSFKATANNSAPGAINAGNGWTAAGSFVHNQCFSTTYPVLSNLAIDIPAGSTYRIWISNTNATNVVRSNIFFPSAGVSTGSNGGVDIMTGDSIGWWGSPTASGASNPFIDFVGSIEFYQSAACTGSPEVGSIVGPTGACSGDNRFYYLNGYIPGNNITYQWQVSTTSPTTGFTNTGTNTTMLARTHGATNEFFRCIATCGSLRDTTPIFADTLNPFYLCYCKPTVPSTPSSWGSIETVQFATTSTSNTASPCENYTDYRSLPIPKVRAGEPLSITLGNKICSPNGFNYAANCWIDLNRSGVFDAGEAIVKGFNMGGANNISAKVTQNYNIPLASPIGITGMRFHLNGNATAPPTDPCNIQTLWAEMEDYLVEIVRDSNDIKMDSITGLVDGCELGNTNINFKATNIGIKTMNPVVVSYSVNGGTPVTENFATLAPGATASYTFTAQANLTGLGPKVIRVWHQNSLDTNKRNDTQIFRIVNYAIPPNLVGQNDTVCIGSTSSTLLAPSTPPFLTRWYSNAAGDTVIGSGDQSFISNPTTTVTRYAKSVNVVTANFGPAAMAPNVLDFGTGQGLFFNVLRNRVRINSVKVRFNTAGVAALEIRNPANTAQLFITSFLVLTPNTDVTVPIGFDLPIGTGYRMVLNSTTGGVFAINDFAGFPQQIPGVISITGNTNTFTPPRYNYFFDWNVTYDVCESPLIPVTSVYLAGVNAPIKTLYKDTFFCQYPTVFLDANNAGSTYKWQDNSTGRTIQVTSSGTYKVSITNAQGCKSTDSSNIVIRSSPIFQIGNDTTICAGKTVRLKSGFSNAGYNHVWSDGSLEPFLDVKSAGEYTVDVFNTATQCGYRDTIVVSTSPSPNAFLGRDTFACNNVPIAIKAPNPGTYTYVWDNGTAGATRTVTTNGVNKIWVDVTDVSNAFGCKATDTILVTLASLVKPNIGPDVVTCTNPQSIGVAAGNDLEYRWSNGGTTNNIMVTETNDYILTVTQVNTTCSYLDTVKVTFRTNPPLDLGPDIFTCKNDPITITANTGWTTYSWSNGFNVNKITVTPSPGDNFYTLNVTGPCGNASKVKKVTYLSTAPDVSLPDDKLVCEPTTLSIPSPGAGVDILWSTNETGNSITVDKTGTYWVSLSNVCGSKTDAIRIIFDTLPSPDFLANWTGTFASFSNKSFNAVTYSWEFGDDSTSTEKHPIHRYAELKEYTVKLTVKNSCDSSVTLTKLIDLRKKPGSIQSTDLDIVSVYPNPTSNEFVIKHSAASAKEYTLEMMTMDGRVVKIISQKFDVNGEVKLNVSNMTEGNYILRLTDAKGNQELKKLSIIR